MAPHVLAGPSRSREMGSWLGAGNISQGLARAGEGPTGPRGEGAARRGGADGRLTVKRAPKQGPLLSGSRAFNKNGVSAADPGTNPGSVAAWRGWGGGRRAGVLRRGHLCTAADSRCYSAETTQSCRATILPLKNKFNIKK